jgi:hypothetical protein
MDKLSSDTVTDKEYLQEQEKNHKMILIHNIYVQKSVNTAG